MAAHAQTVSIDSVALATDAVARFGKFECAVHLQATYNNPYDYDQIAVQGVFSGPDGSQDTVDGFFMQDYLLNPANGALSAQGGGRFKLRYSPRAAGSWTFAVRVSTPAGSAVSAAYAFTCLESDNPGFIRKSNSNYFRFDNDAPFVPVGQNICWPNSNPYTDYKNWLGDLDNHGGNFFRLWLCHWGLGLEWKNNVSGFAGLKKYKQHSAFYIDRLLDECAARDMYMMLCVNHHGQYSATVNPNWNENPYNSANGGPLTQPWQFFSNGQARDLHKNRLRYILARWGYSPHIQCWELFNEVDLTDGYHDHLTEVLAWHTEMAEYLQSRDVYGHLVSTSVSSPSQGDDLWDLPAMDFTQSHVYTDAANNEVLLAASARDLIDNYDKPALVAEFGIGSGGAQAADDDPNGVHLHNSLWATAFSGAAGAALTWWWDNYVEPQNLYYHYAPLAAVLQQLDLAGDAYRAWPAGVNGGPLDDAVFPPGAGWGAPTAGQFTLDAGGNLNPGPGALGRYLYGNQWNTQFRNPPEFTVNYAQAAKFRVRTGGSTGTAPSMRIFLDGALALSQAGTINTVYSIDVPPGPHVIKVDNLGADWIEIAEYVFEKASRAVNPYVLVSADSLRIAGWVHLKKYNWEYLKNTGTPAPVAGIQVAVPGMPQGQYAVSWLDCASGNVVLTETAQADASGLLLNCPTVQWDLAFTAQRTTLDVADAGTRPAERLYPSPALPDSPLWWDAVDASPGAWEARYYDAQGRLWGSQTVLATGDGPVQLAPGLLPEGPIMVTLKRESSLRIGQFMRIRG